MPNVLNASPREAIQEFINNGFDISKLFLELGDDVNVIISSYLYLQARAVFMWPVDIRRAKNKPLCLLALMGFISLPEIARLNNDEIVLTTKRLTQEFFSNEPNIKDLVAIWGKRHMIIMISAYLEQINAVIQWPLTTYQRIEKDYICDLVLEGSIPIIDLANITIEGRDLLQNKKISCRTVYMSSYQIISEMLIDGFLSIKDFNTYTKNFVSLFNHPQVLEYFVNKAGYKSAVQIAIIFELPPTHLCFYPSVSKQILSAETVTRFQKHEDSPDFRLDFFDVFLFQKDISPQKIESSIEFFQSETFVNFYQNHMFEFESESGKNKLAANIYQEILCRVYRLDFTNQQMLNDFLEIAKLKIQEYQIAKAILVSSNVIFTWPKNIEGNPVCQFVLAGLLSQMDFPDDDAFNLLLESPELDILCSGIGTYEAHQLEFAYYKNYLSSGNVQKQQIYLSIHFFFGTKYKALRKTYLNQFELEQSETAKIIYQELLNLVYCLDFSSQAMLDNFILTAKTKIGEFCNQQISQDRSVAKRYMLHQLEDSGFDTKKIIDEFGCEEANKLFAEYLRDSNSTFIWPSSYSQAKQTLLCILTMNGSISLKEVSRVTFSQNRILCTRVALYLKALIRQGRKINLESLFALDESLLKYYPLIDLLSLEIVTILLKDDFIKVYVEDLIDQANTANWMPETYLKELQVVASLMRDNRYHNIVAQVLRPIDKEAAYLEKQPSSSNQNPPSIRSNLLRAVERSFQEVILKHFASVNLEQNNRIDSDKFFSCLCKDLHKSLQVYVRKETVHEDKTLISFLNKTLQQAVSFISSSIMSDNYRLRLFAPESAQRLFRIEDELQKICPMLK